MKVKTAVKLAIVGLAGYGGYVLWKRYGTKLVGRGRGADGAGVDPRRVLERSELTVEEWSVGSDDPVAQAAAILAESDERSNLTRTDEGIERRRSEDTVDPSV